MTITTLSSRQFNQDTSRAKKAAIAGPVFITDRGRPAHVLLTFWRCPAGKTLSLRCRNCATWPDSIEVQRSAKLHVPDPRPVRDGLIAATALVHGMTIVTRDVADFEPTGVSTLNPWQSKA